MPMPPYPIVCQTRDCGQPAFFKVASEWSDGSTHELKTYALCCENCLATWFSHAKDAQRTCRVTIDETLAPPGIYERLPELKRRLDLEG